MPYVIHDTQFPGTQILVNRNYKPIGSNSRAHKNQVIYGRTWAAAFSELGTGSPRSGSRRSVFTVWPA
jgi:hypothetical protein